jgi:hypothetical protein
MEKASEQDVSRNRADFKEEAPFGVSLRPALSGAAVPGRMVRKLHSRLPFGGPDEAPTRVILIALIVADARRQTKAPSDHSHGSSAAD